jgi:hypothetical protein
LNLKTDQICELCKLKSLLTDKIAILSSSATDLTRRVSALRSALGPGPTPARQQALKRILSEVDHELTDLKTRNRSGTDSVLTVDSGARDCAIA